MVNIRSDGYGEYKAILGTFGKIIYHFMFTLISFTRKRPVDRNYMLRGKKDVLAVLKQLIY